MQFLIFPSEPAWAAGFRKAPLNSERRNPGEAVEEARGDAAALAKRWAGAQTTRKWADNEPLASSTNVIHTQRRRLLIPYSSLNRRAPEGSTTGSIVCSRGRTSPARKVREDTVRHPQENAMNWIACKITPAQDGKALCYNANTSSQYFVAEWRDGSWWTEDGIVDPTHYLPLHPPTK